MNKESKVMEMKKYYMSLDVARQKAERFARDCVEELCDKRQVAWIDWQGINYINESIEELAYSYRRCSSDHYDVIEEYETALKNRIEDEFLSIFGE